jgi:hypothetical protein
VELAVRSSPVVKTSASWYGLAMSEKLNIAVGTSKSQYSRAKQNMQALLAKHYQIMNEPFEEAK